MHLLSFCLTKQNKYALIYVILLSFTQSSSSQVVHEGLVHLQSQADVDSFSKLYNGHLDEIAGPLIIGYFTEKRDQPFDIVSLEPLASLKASRITVIASNPLLRSLKGLDSMRYAGPLFISENENLVDISALKNTLISCSYLDIGYNPNLKSIILNNTYGDRAYQTYIHDNPSLDSLRLTGCRVENMYLLRNGTLNLRPGDVPPAILPDSGRRFASSDLSIQNNPNLTEVDFGDAEVGYESVTISSVPNLASIHKSEYFHGLNRSRIRIVGYDPRYETEPNYKLQTIDSIFCCGIYDNEVRINISGFDAIDSVDAGITRTSDEPFSLGVSSDALEYVNLPYNSSNTSLGISHSSHLSKVAGWERLTGKLFLGLAHNKGKPEIGPWNPALEEVKLHLDDLTDIEYIHDFPYVRKGITSTATNNLRLRQLPQFPADAYEHEVHRTYVPRSMARPITQITILNNPLLESTYQGFDIDTALRILIGFNAHLGEYTAINYGEPTYYIGPEVPWALEGLIDLSYVEVLQLGLHGEVELNPFEQLVTTAPLTSFTKGGDYFDDLVRQGPVISFSDDTRLLGNPEPLFPRLRSAESLMFSGSAARGDTLLPWRFTKELSGTPLPLSFPSLDTVYGRIRVQGLGGDTVYMPISNKLPRVLIPGRTYDGPSVEIDGFMQAKTLQPSLRLVIDSAAQLYVSNIPQLEDCSVLCEAVAEGSISAKEILLNVNTLPRVCNNIEQVLIDCKTIGVEEVADGQLDPEFKLYPNPATVSLTIRSGNELGLPEQLQIFTLTGQRVAQISTAGRSLATVDISMLPQGTYIVRVADGSRPGRLLIVQ